MPADAVASAVTLVQGDDASLVAQGARAVVQALLDGRDGGLVVEEFGGPAVEEFDVGQVIDSLMTPAFLVDRRIVVIRDAGKLVTADAKRLAEVLDALPPTSFLVLVAGGGTIPASLVTSVKAKGSVVATSAGTGRQRTDWIGERLRAAGVRLDHEAATLLGDHLGEDVGRLDSLLSLLEATYGSGAKVTAEQLAPFLGEAGAVPKWDLTDAIDGGSPTTALAVLDRMLEAGGRAGPEIIAILHRHYEQMLRLDGAGVSSKEEAKAVLNLKSDFPAGKALRQAQRLGSRGIADAMSLVAAADVDVKGMTGLEPRLVLEIVVARLARLGSGNQPQRRPGRA